MQNSERLGFPIFAALGKGRPALTNSALKLVGDGLLDACITIIPKTDGDATPLGQRPLCVQPVVYRIWASARMGQ